MLSPIEAYIRKNLRFNFLVGLLDGGAFGLGMGFGSFVAIIPLFVHHMTNSALLIGLVPAIHNMGWQLPQLLTAGWIGRLSRYKPLTLAMTVHERLPFLGLAILAFVLPGSTKSLILALTFLMLVWQGFGAGMAANPWTNLVSKVIPQELHGTFFGAQSAAFNGLAGASAIAASAILTGLTTPRAFSICFALTFLFMALSFVFLAFTREPELQLPQAPTAPQPGFAREFDQDPAAGSQLPDVPRGSRAEPVRRDGLRFLRDLCSTGVRHERRGRGRPGGLSLDRSSGP